MNTPKKRRRFDLANYMTPSEAAPKGSFVHALTDDEYAKRLARIISEFEHVETYMPKLLAALLGSGTSIGPAYAYRTLKNPNIRWEVMRDLLEHAPPNAELGSEFDDLLADYNRARVARNTYVHGLWFTGAEGVFLARSDEKHGQGYRRAAREPLAKLDAALLLIRSILRRLVHLHLSPPRIALPPERPPQSAAPTRLTSSRHRIGSGSLPPPPQPSPASPRKPKGQRKQERKAKVAARAKKDGG
jgi:hypothetical protein